MRPVVPLIVLLLLAVATVPVAADAELVLRDGRVLRGVDVRLEAAHYLLETAEGPVVAIPASLVAEVRLLDERVTEEGVTVGPARELTQPDEPLDRLPTLGGAEQKKARPGWREGAPQDLAGGGWTIHDSKRQNAVFGEASGFQESLPFRFKPAHAWDRDTNVLSRSRSTWPRKTFDFNWRPTTAFDHSKDVLAASRSSWSTASRAADWNPANSFSRLRADIWWGKQPAAAREPLPRRRDDECGWCDDIANRPTRFKLPRGAELDPGDCARRLFSRLPDRSTLEVVELEVEAWEEPPADLYRAWVEDGPRALFSTADDTCRLIAGDLRELLGIDLTDKDALAYAVAEWNRRDEADLPAVPLTPGAQIDLAFLLVQLFETGSSGRAAAEMELLDNEAALERVLRGSPGCSHSPRFRVNQRGNATRNFERPETDVREDSVRVTFQAWTGLGGDVHAYDLTFLEDGRVALTRETIAQHLGDHEDAR